MIKLMDLPETNRIMELWERELKELTGLDEEINAYSEVVKETLGHANVYVAHNEKEISGFLTVLEGYYISDLFYTDEETGIELIDEVKKRYDELQIDLHHKHQANHLLTKNGFSKLGKDEHDILGFDEIQYEWLKD